MDKTVLILEAGGASALSCIKLIRKNFPKIKIVGLDIDVNSPGLKLSDSYRVVPRGDEPEFREIIENMIFDYSIDLVLPCFENGFASLSDLQTPFVTDFRSALLCKDKYLFGLECKRKRLPIPNTRILSKDVLNINRPQYVKPRFGVGSRDNYVVEDKNALFHLFNFLNNPEGFIIQDFIEGIHWNVDVFANKQEGFISSIERKDLKQRDGNCITVDVVEYPLLAAFSKLVQKELNICSPFNLEVFETKKGQFVINEINVRFGGGIIFGALAGRDFVSYLISGNRKYLGPIKRGIYTRYHNEIKIE